MKNKKSNIWKQLEFTTIFDLASAGLLKFGAYLINSPLLDFSYLQYLGIVIFGTTIINVFRFYIMYDKKMKEMGY